MRQLDGNFNDLELNSHFFVCRRSVSQGCAADFARPAISMSCKMQIAECLWDFYKKISGKLLAGSRGNLESDYNGQGFWFFTKERFVLRSGPRTREKSLVGEIKTFLIERHRVLSITFLARLWPDSCLRTEKESCAARRRASSYRKVENRDRGKFLFPDFHFVRL